jgi:hypothetical protein
VASPVVFTDNQFRGVFPVSWVGSGVDRLEFNDRPNAYFVLHKAAGGSAPR